MGHSQVGSLNMRMTPGVSFSDPHSPYANIYITAGEVGDFPGRLMSNGEDTEQSLADVISHELGHVDSAWYHDGWDSDGDAVRQENQTRQMEGEPLRIGHDQAGDVPLTGQPY